MSTSIIKDEIKGDFIYCHDKSYPAGLGFELLSEMKLNGSVDNFIKTNIENGRFEYVKDIPKDIQYEYTITKDNKIKCCESWYADKSYHGGGFRHGGVYNLEEWKEKVRRQEEYTYRNEKYWS